MALGGDTAQRGDPEAGDILVPKTFQCSGTLCASAFGKLTGKVLHADQYASPACASNWRIAGIVEAVSSAVLARDPLCYAPWITNCGGSPVICAITILQFFLLASAAPEQQPVQTATAAIKDVQGKQIGTAILTESAEGVRIALDVSKLPAGAHGFHIHSVGKCDPPDFKSAGPHFNPYGKKHGMKNPDGPHAGDLPDIEVGADGTVKTAVITKQVTLGAGKNSLFPEGGTALVIHVDPDDERTDPAGNSGARIACGVITQYVKTAQTR